MGILLSFFSLFFILNICWEIYCQPLEKTFLLFLKKERHFFFFLSLPIFIQFVIHLGASLKIERKYQREGFHFAWWYCNLNELIRLNLQCRWNSMGVIAWAEFIKDIREKLVIFRPPPPLMWTSFLKAS